MDGLAGLSAVEQARLLHRGEVTADELRNAAVAACERLDPALHFLASPLFDGDAGDAGDAGGIPMLLKDAGQEIAGTPHFVGVAALRLRVGLLDHDPELGIPVDPACGAGVWVAGTRLERLGHHVEIGWPAALDRLWGAASSAFGVVSDAVRPPTLAWVGERLGRPVRRGELDDAVFDAAQRAATRSAGEVRAAQDVIDTAVGPVGTWWDDHDLLVTPATFRPAWPLGCRPGPREIGTLAAPFSLTGQPALSLPLHLTSEGLPVGVQIVGRRGADELLLRVASDLQVVDDWTIRRPPVTQA